ncbi:mitochondrial import inner membrane translocase subunit TIM50-C-like isoform X2 [Mercenaria mercenaria]|uniref:mitochondrial import inner membrane translocase subunit TIM50-C-like isoform X2 n=1 Tax=Mercenaria mercenaria TaxID=6596 RepID=UPI00234EA5D8|nr:mitochondrial import inner membrane translocase subunit TIM50-C-like isoform X2 [Mercenaria mercenaria]
MVVNNVWFASLSVGLFHHTSPLKKTARLLNGHRRKPPLPQMNTLSTMEWIIGRPFEDADGNPIEDEYSKYNVIYAYLMRTYREIFFQVKITQEPSRSKLLPDPLTYPYIQPPYTLVIELTDVLLHPEWTYKSGWRFKKRPGIDYFLRTVGPPTFEVVIFTKESGMTADPLITNIDPENFIMYRLYRDATRYQDGEHIKDLNCLNRDLSRVIMVDWNKDAYKLNAENGFNINKWTGDMNDTALGELAEFLRAIAVSKVDDVRPVLKYYSQFDNPMEKFHENQRKLKEEQERQFQAQQSRESKNMTSIWNKFKR